MLGLDDAESNDLISGLDFSVPTKPTEPSTATQPKTPPPKPIISTAVEPEEQGHEPQEGESDDDSGLDELPDPGTPRVIRTRTDRRPLQSPMTPSSSKSIDVIDKKGSTSSPKKP